MGDRSLGICMIAGKSALFLVKTRTPWYSYMSQFHTLFLFTLLHSHIIGTMQYLLPVKPWAYRVPLFQGGMKCQSRGNISIYIGNAVKFIT